MVNMKQKTVDVATCERCGYEWQPNTKLPKQCPYCKSYKWQIPRKGRRKKIVLSEIS